MTPKNVPEILKEMSASLTSAERNVADVLLENHPLSGLGGITALAEKADVSTPTITRLVNKLGFDGYADFQRALKSELDQKMSKDILGGAPWARNLADAHVLTQLTESVIQNIQITLEGIDTNSFDDVCKLMSDVERKVYITGGRITSSIADHLHKYLHVLRANTYLLDSSKNSWHHSMIDMKKGDVLLLYDVRRYEAELMEIASVAKDIGAEIVLITDVLQSPIAEIATHSISGRIMMPNSRSSLITHLLLNEMIIFQMQNLLGEKSKERWVNLEKIFQSSKFFQK